MGRNIRIVFTAIGLVFFVGLAGPVILGKARIEKDVIPGNAWRDGIYDFQTLITGIAAVGAAFVTIVTMEKTDSKSERRHRELIKLQLRPEKRRLERTLNPQVHDLHVLSHQLAEFYNIRADLNETENQDWHWLTVVKDRYLPVFEEIREVLNRRQFQEGVDLFDGTTTHILEKLLGHLTKACHGLIMHRDYKTMAVFSPMEIGGQNQYEIWFPSNFGAVEYSIVGVVVTVPMLIQSLEHVAQTYRAEHT